jgi:hypothetical protein
MTKYILAPVKGDINDLVKTLVEDLCKQNKIDYERQKYRVLFSKESLLLKNNGVKFTSGSKKTLSFYGKIYLNKEKRVVESIYLKDTIIEVEPNTSDILIISSGIDNSTVVEADEAILHFYVAPTYLLELQDPDLWQAL